MAGDRIPVLQIRLITNSGADNLGLIVGQGLLMLGQTDGSQNTFTGIDRLHQGN